METTATTKICDKCGQEKPITEYYRNRTRKDGYSSTCKVCHNAYMKEYHSNRNSKNTPPQSVTEPHPIFSKMQPREIQNEIRERVNYLRSMGWDCAVKLTYTQVREIVI